MIRRPPRSTLFPYTTPLPICEVHKTAGDFEINTAACVFEYFQRAAEQRLRLTDTPRTCQNTGYIGEARSEEHTSELQSQSNLVCRLLLEKKKKKQTH